MPRNKKSKSPDKCEGSGRQTRSQFKNITTRAARMRRENIARADSSEDDQHSVSSARGNSTKLRKESGAEDAKLQEAQQSVQATHEPSKPTRKSAESSIPQEFPDLVPSKQATRAARKRKQNPTEVVNVQEVQQSMSSEAHNNLLSTEEDCLKQNPKLSEQVTASKKNRHSDDRTNEEAVEQDGGKSASEIDSENPKEKENPHNATVDSSAINDDDMPSTSRLARLSLEAKNEHDTLINEAVPNIPAISLPAQLHKIVSNMYLNAAERLQLEYPPRCVYEITFCHRAHYHSQPPPVSLAHGHRLKALLTEKKYLMFVQTAASSCFVKIYPDTNILTTLVEFILNINTKIEANKIAYHKCVQLFGSLVQTFPPCWRKMRHLYTNFLKTAPDTEKMPTMDEDPFSNQDRLFENLLPLLEKCLRIDYPSEMPKASTSAAAQASTSATGPENLTEMFSFNEWEDAQDGQDAFKYLEPAEKLARLVVVFRAIVHILEADFAMWLLHHHRQTSEWIFSDRAQPLIVTMFHLTKYFRITVAAKQLFHFFAKCINKRIDSEILELFERYIVLLMVASNTGDMEVTPSGVKYPFLGVTTKDLIWEFFKIFKSHNSTSISSFIMAINLLRNPFVRYQFIDYFLQLFHFRKSGEMSPDKVAQDLLQKRWLKFKPQAELDDDNCELSREQYLHLLLLGLKAFCDFHGSMTFLNVVVNKTPVELLKVPGISAHRHAASNRGSFLLEQIEQDAILLGVEPDEKICISKPKVNLPEATIIVDNELIAKYRVHLKYLTIIAENLLPEQIAEYPEVDLKQWQTFFTGIIDIKVPLNIDNVST